MYQVHVRSPSRADAARDSHFRSNVLSCRLGLQLFFHRRPAARKADASAMYGREQPARRTKGDKSRPCPGLFLCGEHPNRFVRLISNSLRVKPGRRSGLDFDPLEVVIAENWGWRVVGSVGQSEREGSWASFKLKLLHSPRARGV